MLIIIPVRLVWCSANLCYSEWLLRKPKITLTAVLRLQFSSSKTGGGGRSGGGTLSLLFIWCGVFWVFCGFLGLGGYFVPFSFDGHFLVLLGFFACLGFGVFMVVVDWERVICFTMGCLEYSM